MHSVIFHVSRNEKAKKIKDTDAILESLNSFGVCADYVSMRENRDEFVTDYNWLWNFYDLNMDFTITINSENKKKYFEEEFEKYKEKAEKMTFESFISSDYYLERYEEPCGFWVVNDDCECMSFDEFVRIHDNQSFYIIWSYDYHC